MYAVVKLCEDAQTQPRPYDDSIWYNNHDTFAIAYVYARFHLVQGRVESTQFPRRQCHVNVQK